MAAFTIAPQKNPNFIHFLPQSRRFHQDIPIWWHMITDLYDCIVEMDSSLVRFIFGSCTFPTDTFHFAYHTFNAPERARYKISNA